jgi:hypothetical protein
MMNILIPNNNIKSESMISEESLEEIIYSINGKFQKDLIPLIMNKKLLLRKKYF